MTFIRKTLYLFFDKAENDRSNIEVLYAHFLIAEIQVCFVLARHPLLNWDSFQKLAQKLIEMPKLKKIVIEYDSQYQKYNDSPKYSFL